MTKEPNIRQIAAEHFHPDQIALGQKQHVMLTFTADEIEEEGNIPLHIVKGNEAGPVLVILAAVHGDEYEGIQTVIELIRMLSPEHIRGTLMMVSIANLYAYHGVSRTTPEDGRNLARVFPGRPDGSITERLAWHLSHRIITHADFLLDLHSGGTFYEVAELVGFYDHDEEEIGRKSKAAAEAFGMEVLWGHKKGGAGRSISFATERGIPWLYTEAAGGRRIKRHEQLRFRLGALRLMNYLGMLLHPDQWITEPKPSIKYRLTGRGNFDEPISAPCEGFFIPAVSLLEQVNQGDLIGTIYDSFGNLLYTCQAPVSGIIVTLAGTPAVQQGSALCMIAQLKASYHETSPHE